MEKIDDNMAAMRIRYGALSKHSTKSLFVIIHYIATHFCVKKLSSEILSNMSEELMKRNLAMLANTTPNQAMTRGLTKSSRMRSTSI
jgi:hypothetical protein